MYTKASISWVLKTSLRYINNGSIVVANKSTGYVQKKKAILEMALKKKSRKYKKKKVIVKKSSDEIEGIWLENLNLDNLKLYRKTSFGSFRKINVNRLLEKLQILYPNLGSEDKNDIKLSTIENNLNSGNLLEDKSQLASPYISDFLIQNMTSFPLLKSNIQPSLKNVLKEEKEDFGTVDTVKFPSVTKILSETMSEMTRVRLNQWKMKMIEKLGEEGFYKHQQDKIFMRTPRKQKRIVVDLLKRGAKFHKCLKKYLESGSEQEVTIDSEIEGCWNSMSKLLPDISNVMMVEESLYHPVLMYRGIVDCVASYRNVPCVIEWKKSDKKKPALTATYDAPLQLCAYLGALSWHKNFHKTDLKNGLVVVAYTNGDPANVFSMDLECCQVYWSEWLRRLQSYWVSRSSTLIQEEIEV